MKVSLTLHLAGAAILVASTGVAFAQPATPPPASAPVVPLSPATNRAVAERAATLLADSYVTPAISKRYAAMLRRNAAAGCYAAITDPAALADRLTADLQAVARDVHLRFYRVDPAPPPPPAPPPASAAATVPAQEGERSIAPGIRAIRWVRPGVAYISFEHFDDRPEAIAVIRRFLADYAGARALVIDARGHHGGAFDMMGILANHLFGAPRHLADMDMATSVYRIHGSPFPVDGRVLRVAKGPPAMTRFQHWAMPEVSNRAWFDVPVYYLTSRATFSAAEHFAMVLKSTGRGVLIGETTGGGNHFGGTEPVGGGLEMYVPIGRTGDPATGRDWEAVGIVPDVAVPEGPALDVALRRIAAPR